VASVNIGGPRAKIAISTLPDEVAVKLDSRTSDTGISQADQNQLNQYKELHTKLEKTCISRLDATVKSANTFTRLTNALGWSAFGAGLVTSGLSTYVAAQPQLEKDNKVIISAAIIAIMGGTAAAVANKTASEASNKKSQFSSILGAKTTTDNSILEQNRLVEDTRQLHTSVKPVQKAYLDAEDALAAAQEQLDKTLPTDPSYNAVKARRDDAKKSFGEAHQRYLDVKRPYDDAVAKLRAAMAVVGAKLDDLQAACRLITG
jgi:hypothetical protein